MRKKKAFGIDISQWLLIFILIVMEKLILITFAHAIIINVIVTGLALILQEVIKIRKCLENLQRTLFHINCRHQIMKYEEEA